MKIFISYSHQDSEKALLISDYLRQNNYEVLGDFNLKVGESISKSLNNRLLEADAIVFLITANFNSSKYANQELITAYSYYAARNKLILLPILFEGGELPVELGGTLYLSARDEKFNKVLLKLVANLSLIRNELETKQKEKAENKEILQTSLSEYIKKALKRLERNELQNRTLSYLCYVGSGLFILVAILFSLFKTKIIFSIDTWQTSTLQQMTSILSLALILALSRLFFVLGKSFMVESIRNSDRIHAISFGEFFLNAYGGVATRDEVREVFGNWNIDNGSSFITQSPKDYDPQIVENLIKAVELFKGQVKK